MARKSKPRMVRASSRAVSPENTVTVVSFHDFDPVQLQAAPSLIMLALSAISPSLGLGSISDRLSLMVENFRFYRIKKLRLRGWYAAASGQPSTGVPTGVLQYQPYQVTAPSDIYEVEVPHAVVVPGHSISTSGGAAWQPSEWLDIPLSDFDTPTRWRLTDDDGAGIQNGYGDIDLTTTGSDYTTGVYLFIEWKGIVEFKQPVEDSGIAAASPVDALIERLRRTRTMPKGLDPDLIGSPPSKGVGLEPDEDGKPTQTRVASVGAPSTATRLARVARVP